MEGQLLSLLQKRSIQIDQTVSLSENITKMIDQKQQMINNLSQQITRYKCQQIKNEKLIKSLQEKISQLSPNISNTSSSFMMGSQFKSSFEQLMTTLLPTALGWAIDRPYLFSKCVQDVFLHTYNQISDKLNGLIGQICSILKIGQQNETKLKIKLNLLKIFQQHSQLILPTTQNQFEYNDNQNKMPPEVLEDINQQINSQDFIEMRKHLHKLCIYMILQDKQWHFQDLGKESLVKYSKKQYICIDGWIKDGNEALLVLGGIKRQAHLHPNLKNYVIPFSKDNSSELYHHLAFIVKSQRHLPSPCQLQTAHQKLQSSPLENSQSITIENDVEILPLKPIFMGPSNLTIKNPSIELMNNKENLPYALNKKSKKKDKLKFSMDTSLNLPEKSPKNILRKHDQSIKNKKIEIDQVDEKIYQIRDQSKMKKKSLMISKNINDAPHELLPLKERNLEELPVSKDANHKKKTKACTSRKNSVGKIVNQNHMLNHDKQNTQNINNSKMKTKQKMYKDIIKEKLLDDKIQEKTQHSLNILYPKSRTDRDKKRQQNRPLKIQNNASKLRQKYIF